jgi:hypothetical protein
MEAAPIIALAPGVRALSRNHSSLGMQALSITLSVAQWNERNPLLFQEFHAVDLRVVWAYSLLTQLTQLTQPQNEESHAFATVCPRFAITSSND